MTNEQGFGLLPPALLRLPPRAESVRDARRFLRGLLRSIDRECWGDTAELALSEIVTNGVLHAHTELTVRITASPDLLEVEVADGNPSLPSQRRTSSAAESTTGRGLELVAALTLDCGVRPEPGGKVVWFTMADTTAVASDAEPAGAEPLPSYSEAVWDSDDWERAPAPDLHHVVLARMPTSLWMAAREHHQALLRELVLYTAEHPDVVPSLPDLALADQARHLIWTGLLAALDGSGSTAGGRQPEAIDLPLAVPAELGPAFGALQDALDVGERLAVADRLLVRPALPEIVAVRDWACEQVVAQLAGVPASPWPGTDSAQFEDVVHDRHDVPVSWDSAPVTSSERGVVAADDANRILAISAPLASALGWEPADLVGRRVVVLIPPELREAHVVGFSRHLTTGEAHVLGQTLHLPVLRRDGTTLPCSFLVERAVLEGDGARAVYLAWIDPVAV